VRIPFVGETGDVNIYDAVCVLAQDVDLSRGILEGRRADEQLDTADRRRVFVKGDGTIVASSGAGYGFVWNNDVYLLNGQNDWRKNGDTGQWLSPPSAPSIQSHALVLPEYEVDIAGRYSPTPTVFDEAGWSKWNMSATGRTTFTVTLTFASAVDLSEYSGLYVAVGLPSSVTDLQLKIGTTSLPLLGKQAYWQDSDTVAQRYFFDLTIIPASQRTAVTSLVFTYTATSNHVLWIYRKHWRMYFVRGKVVYLATLTRNNAESLPSSPYEVPILHEFALSYGVQLTIAGCSSGDIVKLYRSVGESYYLVAQGTASGSTTTLTDKGNIGERYIPSGILPFGPAVVWGNRVAIAQGNELYISAVGLPERYSQGMLNDTGDPYRVVLPERIIALTVVDGALVAYSRQHTWVWQPVRTLYENDNLSSVVPQRVEAIPPLSDKSVDGNVVAALDGLYVNGRLVFRKQWSSSSPIVLSRGNLVCVVDGRIMYVLQSPMGWVRYTLPLSQVHWLAWDGQYLIAAGVGGVYRIGSSSTRMSGKWRSGRITTGNKFLVEWIRVFSSQTCSVTLKTDVGDYAPHVFNMPDRWKPADSSAGGRALRWAQLEVNISGLQNCEAIEIELKPVALR
jgi:hypothetical protein